MSLDNSSNPTQLDCSPAINHTAFDTSNDGDLPGPAPGWRDWEGAEINFGGAREVYLCEFERGTGAQFILVWIKRAR